MMYKNNGAKLIRPFIRNGKVLFHGTIDLFFFSFFLAPSYFGVRLAFFDLTLTRFFLILCLIGIWQNDKRQQLFLAGARLNKSLVPFYLFQAVCIGTNLLRFSMSGLFNVVVDTIITFFVFKYIIQYEYGVGESIRRIKKCAVVLGVLGVIEGLTHVNVFDFFDTLHKGAGTESRFGLVRISGPCTTGNGYGLYLLILIPLICYDISTKKIEILKNKWLLLLLVLNVLFNGARLTMGICFVEILLLVLLSDPKQWINLFGIGAILVAGVAFICIAFPKQSFSLLIMKNVTSVIDTVFNTNYGSLYGIDKAGLYNSNHYRELLLKIFSLDYLNPILGRGSTYRFSYVMEGYWLRSIDNYYVNLYIMYAYPGLAVFLLMSGCILISILKRMASQKDALWKVLGVIFVCYYISLWYLDQLQTYKYIYVLFAMILVESHSIYQKCENKQRLHLKGCEQIKA